jgi:alkylated DNA repair protein (DNA oxidative demethylase)
LKRGLTQSKECARPGKPQLAAWDDLSPYKHPPEACLVNFYDASARMGLHQDRDENDFDAPVVSL